MYFCFYHSCLCSQQLLESLNHEINYKKKDGPTKTILIHEMPLRENFGPTNTHQKTLDPRNTHERKFQSHKIPTTKNFGSTKYPREKILDPRNTHEKKFWTHEIPTKARCHDGTKPTRPTIAHDP